MGGNDDFTCNFFLSLSLIPSHLLADLSEKRKARLLRLHSFLWVNVVISGSFISVSVGVDVALLWKFSDNCIVSIDRLRFPWVGYPIPNHGIGGEERPLSPAHLTGRIVDNRRNDGGHHRT